MIAQKQVNHVNQLADNFALKLEGTVVEQLGCQVQVPL